MKVFISWSGNISHQMALILREWLAEIMPKIETWVSSEDINKGTMWSVELTRQLEETSYGIVCIDSSNIYSPWINFEAGSISTHIGTRKVFPVLYNMSPSDLKGPLAQFQVTVFERAEIYKLLQSLNSELKDDSLDTSDLEKRFRKLWPKLRKRFKKIDKSKTSSSVSVAIEINDDLDRFELEILKHFDMMDLYLDMDYLLRVINAEEIKINYFINKLIGRNFLEQDKDGTWCITKKGIAFLVESGAI